MNAGQGLQNAHAMLAFYNGRPIQYRWVESKRARPGDCEWRTPDYLAKEGPVWSFEDFEYRPKPEPVTRPWSKTEDVPLNCWLKFSNDSWGETMVIAVRPRGIYLANIDQEPGVSFMEWKHLESKYTLYSTDRKAWKPCTVEVPA